MTVKMTITESEAEDEEELIEGSFEVFIHCLCRCVFHRVRKLLLNVVEHQGKAFIY